MSAPWTREELAWARDCVGAGDTVEDIAEMAGRSVVDVRMNVGFGVKLTDRERLAVSLYAAGTPVREIGRQMKADTPRPDSLAMCALNRARAKGYPLPLRREAAHG